MYRRLAHVLGLTSMRRRDDLDDRATGAVVPASHLLQTVRNNY